MVGEATGKCSEAWFPNSRLSVRIMDWCLRHAWGCWGQEAPGLRCGAGSYILGTLPTPRVTRGLILPCNWELSVIPRAAAWWCFRSSLPTGSSFFSEPSLQQLLRNCQSSRPVACALCGQLIHRENPQAPPLRVWLIRPDVGLRTLPFQRWWLTDHHVH